MCFRITFFFINLVVIWIFCVIRMINLFVNYSNAFSKKLKLTAYSKIWTQSYCVNFPPKFTIIFRIWCYQITRTFMVFPQIDGSIPKTIRSQCSNGCYVHHHTSVQGRWSKLYSGKRYVSVSPICIQEHQCWCWNTAHHRSDEIRTSKFVC